MTESALLEASRINIDRLPNILITWMNGKIEDLSRCVAIFFNYLAISREGFMIVKPSTDEMVTQPVITGDMVKYVLSEIFPCGVMTGDKIFKTESVPKNIQDKIETVIRSYVQKKYMKTKESSGIDLQIKPIVYQLIWNYISNGLNSLLYNSKDEDEIKEKLLEAEASTLARRNCLVNYGFNEDIENCAFQALLYVIVSCTDWLEYDVVGKDEVMTAYNIIVPPSLQYDINPVKNCSIANMINSSIIARDLTPDKEAIDLLCSIMLYISQHLNDETITMNKILNRFMAFSNPV